MTAGQTVSNLLTQMKQKALAASDTSRWTPPARAALNSDFQSLRNQITQVVSNADFNGTNLITSGSKNYNALANAEGTSTITVLAEDLSLGGANLTGVSTTSVTIGTVTIATAMAATARYRHQRRFGGARRHRHRPTPCRPNLPSRASCGTR